MISFANVPLPQPPPDTIAAISTPPGRGGIGIVRLSGPGAGAVAASLLRLKEPLEHARARWARVVDLSFEPPIKSSINASADMALHPAAGPESGPAAGLENAGAVIDEAVVTAFFAPRSYTGEDLVEIAAHGSPVVLDSILRGALARGARLARAGEFTERAFLSGRLDLTQAEAVHDLIAAQTMEQARVAAQQMGGAISRQVGPAKELLLHLIALLEAGMDFASGELDDVEVVPKEQIAAEIAGAAAPLEMLAASFRRGQLLRNGAAIALIGAPNAGKSSLFNKLLERERAIVTPLPGTTRDTVEEAIAIGGIPVRLIDTAGLREAAGVEVDTAERQGIARSREALADADLVLLIRDVTEGESAAEQEAAAMLEGRQCLRVENKVDLVQDPGGVGKDGVVRTSALTGAGVEELRSAILEKLGAPGLAAEGGAINNLRQQEAITTTLEGLAAAAAANSAGLPHEVILMDLHRALQALDALTGATTTENILGRIFATFCIGK